MKTKILFAAASVLLSFASFGAEETTKNENEIDYIPRSKLVKMSREKIIKYCEIQTQFITNTMPKLVAANKLADRNLERATRAINSQEAAINGAKRVIESQKLAIAECQNTIDAHVRLILVLAEKYGIKDEDLTDFILQKRAAKKTQKSLLQSEE